MKTILITNDDGYISKGLIDLVESLRDMANIVVVAPANEKSACGHGLCVSKPLDLIKIKDNFYKLDDGSPTDCVYVALCELFPSRKPDLIISGINIGSNMGEDTTYSGTVAGAMEGAIHGIPSIAISQCVHDNYGEEDKIANRDFSLATLVVKNIANDILTSKLIINDRKFLNINVPQIPKDTCKGVKITHLGVKLFNPSISQIHSPRGKTYHWIGFNKASWSRRDNSGNAYLRDYSGELISDFEAITDGYISITPMQLDLTDYEMMKYLDYSNLLK